MASTRNALARLTSNLDESIGHRSSPETPNLSPVPNPKDVGRRPIRSFGSLQVDQIVADPDQPRTEFDHDAIERLAASIRETGQISPIHVRWSAKLEKWVIISGERRWRATVQAGLQTIQCHFHDQPLSPTQILEQQLIENLLREDLKPIEQARAFRALMDLNEWTARQVAEALHVQPSTVSRALALLRLPKEVRAQVDSGALSARSAYELSKLEDPEEHHELARQIHQDKLTHQEAAQVVRERRRKPAKPRRGVKLAFVIEPDWRVTVTAPRRASYREVKQVVEQVLEEVAQRLNNNVQLL